MRNLPIGYLVAMGCPLVAIVVTATFWVFKGSKEAA